MNEHPILFSGDMVKAILDGRKTQTRRVIKPQPIVVECPYGQPGDLLWVREAWRLHESNPNGLTISKYAVCDGEQYWRVPTNDQLKVMGYPDASYKLRPSIHMPRWASRITLEIVDVRVDRVQNISEEDAESEGVYCVQSTSPGLEDKPYYRSLQSTIRLFNLLWDSINAKRGYSWESNPWVWVIEFKKIGG